MGNVMFTINGELTDGHYPVVVSGTTQEGFLSKKFVSFPVEKGDLVNISYRKSGKHKCEKVKLKRSQKDRINLIYNLVNKKER